VARSETARERERAARKLQALRSGDFWLHLVEADGSVRIVRRAAHGSPPSLAAIRRESIGGHATDGLGEAMPTNVEILRSGYEAFGRGDIEGITENFAEDIEFVGPNSQRMPGAGTHRGRDAVRALLAGMRERWDDQTWSPDEFVSEGETIVVLGHMEGRAKATGMQVKVPFVHIWRMSGGKATRGQALTDTAVVAEALGK
jgi:ketosteroid isomerase-like protein